MAITLENARSLILDSVAPLGAERVELLHAAGRVLAEEIRAPWDKPRWDNSAVDGFAVHAEDCGTAAHLTVRGYLPTGASAAVVHIAPGTAVKIMTGAPVPAGCDAVVPIEETEEDGDEVYIRRSVTTGQHIRRRGEDMLADALLLPAGTLLRPPEINLLASFGQAFVPVIRRPRVAILSSGDELVELGDATGPGQIVNSNALSLAAAVHEAGGDPIRLGIARDNRKSHREKLANGLKADMLITSARVSMCDRNLVRDVLAELGVEQVFWNVDIKPGHPTAFSRKGETPIFALPGDPVATMLTFETFVRPALLKMQGYSEVFKPAVKAHLPEPAGKDGGRVQFLRVQIQANGKGLLTRSAGGQNTGSLRTMMRANGIAVLPAERAARAAGEQVEVIHPGPQTVS